MKEKKTLIILLAGSLYFLSPFIKPLCAAEEDKTPQANPQSQPQGVVPRLKEEFETQGLRDPFRNYFEESVGPGDGDGGVPREPEVQPPPLTVQGIICGGRFNQAIINNKVVKVGDTVDNVLITGIEKEGITVFFSNKSFKIFSPAVNTIQGLEKKPEGG